MNIMVVVPAALIGNFRDELRSNVQMINILMILKENY